MPAAPPPAPGASRKPRVSPSRKPKPRKNWPMRTAPDVSTVAHAARLAKRFAPEQLGLSKTCTRVDWGDGADARADGDADATLDHLSERVVRLSATRAALSSLGALARAARAARMAPRRRGCRRRGRRDILVLPRRRPRRSPPRAPRQTHPRPRAHARVIVQDDGVGQRRARPEHGGGTSSSTDAPRGEHRRRPRGSPSRPARGLRRRRRQTARRPTRSRGNRTPSTRHRTSSTRYPPRSRGGRVLVRSAASSSSSSRGEISGRARRLRQGSILASHEPRRAPVPLGVRVLAQGVDSP